MKVGDKVRCFKFNSYINTRLHKRTPVIIQYNELMDVSIGKIGTIQEIDDLWVRVLVETDDANFYYPIEEVKKHLVRCNQKASKPIIIKKSLKDIINGWERKFKQYLSRD